MGILQKPKYRLSIQRSLEIGKNVAQLNLLTMVIVILDRSFATLLSFYLRKSISFASASES